VPKNPEQIVKALWDIFSTVFSMSDIKHELTREIRIALCGNSPRIEELQGLFKTEQPESRPEEGGGAGEEAPANGSQQAIQEKVRVCAWPPDDEDAKFIEKCHIAIFIINAEGLSLDGLRPYIEGWMEKRPKRFLWLIDGAADEMRREEIADRFEEMAITELHWIAEEWGSITRLILKKVSDRGLACAKAFQFLRDDETKKLIAQTARENSYIAFSSSLPTNIPIIGIIIGLIAVAGETLIITASQIRMCLRIAGIYGFKVDFTERMTELWPVLAGAFGWRTLARGLSGFIPGGGPIIKTSIAYAGTMMAGHAAQWFYRDGKKLTREEMSVLYDNEKKHFLDNVNGFISKLKGKSSERDLPEDMKP
jgi:uncharacterized protein (DUF697 family)